MSQYHNALLSAFKERSILINFKHFRLPFLNSYQTGLVSVFLIYCKNSGQKLLNVTGRISGCLFYFFFFWQQYMKYAMMAEEYAC